MKIRASLNFDVNYTKFAAGIYVAIRQAIILIITLTISLRFKNEFTNLNSSGFDSSNIIFMFICGLVFFKDQFFAQVQFGRSKETAVVSSLINIAILAMLISIVDFIIGWFYAAAFSGELFSNFRSLFFQNYSGKLTFGVSLLNLLWNFFYLAFIGSIGYLIALINYKLPKKIRLLIWLGIPVLLIIINTRLIFMRGGLDFLTNFYGFTKSIFGLPFNSVGNPIKIYLTGTLFFAFNGLVSLLLINKTPIKD
ncbi:MAG: hypothetical protein PHD05_07115 [Sphaerochaetaceae bacterium]|nr:hypothetical protein [Sphaerochaetaceae bacterium]